jgi:alkylation response protein AidB-like acyl-CoA dehydrogenase
MLSFTPDDEQRMVIDTIHRYAEQDLRKVAHEADEASELPPSVVEKGWGLGILPGNIPDAYGGYGEHSALTGVLAAEEMAWGDLSAALHVMAPNLVAIPILLAGTDEQRQKMLPMFCDMKFPRAAAAVIEPDIRFDVNRPSTTATANGGTYTLNGTKAYVPLAADADTILVFASDSETGKVDGYMVEKGTAGVEVGEREKLMGIRALDCFRVTLNNSTVGVDCKLGGEEGSDFSQILAHSRVAVAALAVGVGRAALEYARDYAKERVQFGVPIATKQAIAFMLADMAIEVDGARLMVWEAAWLLDQGQDAEAQKQALLAKRYAEEMALFVTDSAVQVLGGHGYIREHPVERWLRNGRGIAMFDGLAVV